MLSPYLRPQGINGGITVNKLATDAFYNPRDGLDKRTGGTAGLLAGVRTQVNAAKAIGESITNALGVRSPYYVIGEIPSEDAFNPAIKTVYNFSALGGIIRAVQALKTTEQEGVIIDCLGDVSSTISVEFTKNPLLYQSSTVIDSRVRKPTVVKATVAVSNYLSDDLVGSVASGGINSIFGAFGLADLGQVVGNELMYDGNTRAQKALYNLRWLMENGRPFTVYTPHGFYENMLIRSLEPKTTETSMDMLLCDITFEEAIMYRPYFTSAENTVIPTRTNVSGKEPSGLSDNAKIFWDKIRFWRD